MEIVENKDEYTFFQSTSITMTPDVMLPDIYEVGFCCKIVFILLYKVKGVFFVCSEGSR